MKTTTAKTKATVIAAPQVEQPQHDQASLEGAMSNEGFSMRDWLAMCGIELPSGKRLIIGFILGIAASYLTASACMQVAAALMIGTFALTASAFLVNCVWVLGIVLAAIASFKAFSIVNKWVIGGVIERKLGEAKDRTVAWVNTQTGPAKA